MLHNRRRKPHSLVSQITERKRKRVTLIAAFKCDQGVVICADTKETISIPHQGEYRVRVTKIKPQSAGEYDIVIGGAGDAHLVDGFSRKLVSEIAGWQPSLDDESIETRITSLAMDYHSTHVALAYHGHPPDPLNFLLCIKRKNDPNILLWELRDTVIIPTEGYSLLGWEEAIYEYEVKWLYREGLRISQAALLGIRLFAMAKETSNYIGGDTQLIVVTASGMEAVDQEQVNTLEDRVETFNNAMARLVLGLPDTSIDQQEFANYLTEFRRLALNTRESYIGEWRGRSLYRAIFDPTWKGDTVQQNPPGMRADRTRLEDGRVMVDFSTTINVDGYDEEDDPQEPDHTEQK
ncbi:MAG: hypothetical protein QOG23_3576 [Blastocatellia bacterium]|jgi:hypothetical protein|nr:hypothetical protein [Blastocatellia bacterium]